MKKRITMTICDSKAFEILKSRTIEEIINATKATEQCLMVYPSDILVCIEKNKGRL